MKAAERQGRNPSEQAKGAGSPSNENIVLRDDSDGVALLTLNRPAQRNSLSEAMIGALQTAFDEIRASRDVRAVVVTGVGSAFCAGHDLKELTRHRADADRGRAHFTEIMTACATLMQSIVASPKPVIAAVNGIATAAGCQLVASCDLAVASQQAEFCTPGVDIGLFCSSPMVALTRAVPRKRAMEMLLLGDRIGANTARDFGLVNRVAAPERVLAEALALAERIAAKPPATLAAGKSVFQRQLDRPLGEAYREAAEAMVAGMLHAESVEGIGAFLEKRPARWRPD